MRASAWAVFLKTGYFSFTSALFYRRCAVFYKKIDAGDCGDKIYLMDNASKKFMEEKIGKLAEMLAKGFAETATKTEVDEKIEKLAEMVAIGFAATATKVEMDERFDIVDERLGGIDERLNKVDWRLGNRQQELDDLRDRMRMLETRVDRIEIVKS